MERTVREARLCAAPWACVVAFAAWLSVEVEGKEAASMAMESPPYLNLALLEVAFEALVTVLATKATK